MDKSRRAKLVKTPHGLKPKGDGWFVLNAADAVWFENPRFGRATRFEGDEHFAELGLNIRVLDPGQPNCHYHAETEQEDFLVLQGRCSVIINGKELPLRAWDLVHCPPGTQHVFVGAGKEPCAILMMGARKEGGSLLYPRAALAARHGASAKKTTTDPRESYADVPRSQLAKGKWPIRAAVKRKRAARKGR